MIRHRRPHVSETGKGEKTVAQGKGCVQSAKVKEKAEGKPAPKKKRARLRGIEYNFGWRRFAGERSLR